MCSSDQTKGRFTPPSPVYWNRKGEPPPFLKSELGSSSSVDPAAQNHSFLGAPVIYSSPSPGSPLSPSAGLGVPVAGRANLRRACFPSLCLWVGGKVVARQDGIAYDRARWRVGKGEED